MSSYKRTKLSLTLKLVAILVLAANTLSEHTIVSIKQVADAVNDVRQNPQKYPQIIQSLFLDKMNANNIHTEWHRYFKEGRAAIDEAIEFLKNASPLPAVEVDKYISHCAWKHSIYQNSINQMTHTGSGGSDLRARISRYGPMGYASECIVRSNSVWANTGTLVVL